MNILTYFSFDTEGKPYFMVVEDGEIVRRELVFGENLTLEFDVTKRFCTGWHDIETKENFVCPENAEVEKKYEQCKKCMDRTGFNPAFYHAGEVSAQQESYNAQAHGLYLAYFSDKYVKVGISRASRTRQRLLEQGARAALVLEEFKSANVARQYEAKVADVEGVLENLQVAKKIELLEEAFDFEKAKEKLLADKMRIEDSVGVKFASDEVLSLDEFYGEAGNLRGLVDMGELGVISGNVVACVGSVLIVKNGDDLLGLAVKKFLGYEVKIGTEVRDLELPAQQVSLF